MTESEKQSIKVAFDRENFNKCLCGNCPVQRNSDCARHKEEQLRPLKEAIEQEAKMPEPADIVAGLYCSFARGKSDCADLSPDKACLCPACPVFFQQSLINNYYCVQGSADQVG